MRSRSAITTLLLAGLGLGLSACYYAPAPGYAYYDSGSYYPSYSSYYYPSYSGYYGPAYYGPSVGFYYSGGWRDRRWH